MTSTSKRKQKYRKEALRMKRLLKLHGATKNCDGQMTLLYSEQHDSKAEVRHDQ